MVTPTNWSAISDFNGMIVSANTNFPFWALIMWMINLIFFLTAVGRFGLIAAWLSSAFLGTIIGVILAYAGLVGWTYVLTVFGLLVAGIIYSISTEPTGY